MAKTILVLVCILLSSLTHASEILISLYEHDPWRMAIGADSPTFVLYDDGKAIFWNGDLQRYQYVTLTNIEIQRETNAVKPLAALNDRYTLSRATDQPSQELVFKLGNSYKTISIYGDMRREEQTRRQSPAALLNQFDHFANYGHLDAENWFPAYLEILIWPYDYAPAASIHWPDDWPDLESGYAVKRGNGYSIYLSIYYLAEFQQFIETQNPNGAVVINGQKWAISTRIPFPHEVLLN